MIVTQFTKYVKQIAGMVNIDNSVTC